MSPSPTPTPSAVTAQPLPPLPDLTSSAPAGGGTDQPNSGILAALMSGVAPVKMQVDAINKACQEIAKLGVIPGAEQICGQIVALATSMLPLAAQSAMGMGGGGMAAMPPPPKGPAPMGGPPPAGGPPAGGM